MHTACHVSRHVFDISPICSLSEVKPRCHNDSRDVPAYKTDCSAEPSVLSVSCLQVKAFVTFKYCEMHT